MTTFAALCLFCCFDPVQAFPIFMYYKINMEQITEYVNQLSLFFDTFDTLKMASEKSGAKSALIVIVAAIIIISILVASFGIPILCDLVGTLYPTYMSYRAIETPEPGDDKQWLTYWVVYASTKIMDAT